MPFIQGRTPWCTDTQRAAGVQLVGFREWWVGKTADFSLDPDAVHVPERHYNRPQIAPGPCFVSQSRQGIISSHPPSLLALSAGFPFALALASNTIFSACLASYRLAYGPAGSICQPKVGNVGMLGLHQGCSLPALLKSYHTLPCLQVLMPCTHAAVWETSWGAGSKERVTIVQQAMPFSCLPHVYSGISSLSPGATRILANLLITHLDMLCRQSLKSRNSAERGGSCL